MLADRIGIPQVREMAGRSERVVAYIELSELERIADLFSRESADGGYRLRVEAQFADHGRGFPELECHVDGRLPLHCQRCLGLLDWNVELDFSLAIIQSDAELDTVTDKFDAIAAGEHGFSLTEVVTDEVLGSLPLAPMHADGKQCLADNDYIGAASDGDDNQAEQKAEQVNRPFANLDSLVRQGKQAGNTDKN